LASEPEGSFDLIVIDAFSSDAIPTHLLTREAIELYLSRLAPGGVLALHISNRAFNLAPVLCRYAQDLRLAALDNDDVVASRQQVEEGKSESWWFALARDPACFDGLRANNVFWRTPTDLARTDLPLWTDQRSDVLSVLIW
jgi:spermidine synthase